MFILTTYMDIVMVFGLSMIEIVSLAIYAWPRLQ